MNQLRIIFIFFVFCFIAIIIRLFFIQVLMQDTFAADYVTTKKLEPVRGKILDTNLEPLALNQTRYLVYVEPKQMNDKEKVVEALDKVLKIGEATLEARINPDKVWVSIRGSVSKEDRKKLESYNLKGIGFQEETERFYPEASLAAHLLGFMGKDDNGESIGYFGVEGFYDKDLAGLPGVLKSERDLLDRPIFMGTQERVNAEDGRDIVLTIDKSVQHIIKERLKKGIEDSKAKSGCVIAVDPHTMAILGLVCLPDFDPTTYYDFSQKDFADWAISSSYEPGSTFKPLVMAAAIEEKALRPTDNYDEKSAVERGGYTIRNWNDKYEGKISVTRILEKSSNVGMVYVGDKLGKQKLNDYISKYGFGDYTQIDLQGEVPGQVKELKDWYPIDAATMAFGQGISVTAMQLVRAFAAVVNGGYLMRPYIVKEVIEDGTHKVREPQVQRRVLSEDTSRIMRRMLVSTVAHAEAKWDIPEGFTFGGKTGTAQIALDGKYDASKTIASFMGFAPASDPKFLMLVVMREPGSSSWGSETAAPLFFQIAKDLLVYYNIPAEK